MNNIELKTTLFLAFRLALLGEVTANIRGITCSWDERKVIVKFIFDGFFSEEEQENMDCVATEVIADLPDHDMDVEFLRIDFPEPLENHKLAEWVYLRKE
jgi:hypothetical protein